MSSYSLKLCSFLGQTIELSLSYEPGSIMLKHCSMDSSLCVRSDVSYTAELIGDAIPDAYDLLFYVNSEEIQIRLNHNTIEFQENKGRVFLSNIGLIQITLEIISPAGTIVLYTDYLPVLVRNNTINLSVQRMAEYVYNHQEDFLLHSKLPSRVNKSIKPNAPKELESQLQIISKIIQVYSEQYQYFSSNSKFKLRPEGHIDDFEKIQKISSSTLTYITQHPEQLMPVNYVTGISKNRQQYIPRKVLIFHNSPDFDTYENRSIVNFLQTVIHSICCLLSNLDKRIDSSKINHDVFDDYFNSAWFIIEVSQRRLHDYRATFLDFKSKIESLYIAYSSILPVETEPVSVVPKPTPVFLSIPPYRLIYNQIDMWFRFGIYNFEREDFMLPFTQTHKLYEYYVLLKLHSYIQKCGFHYQRTKAVDYPNLNYVIDSKNNTFYYSSGVSAKTITLFYEPVIYGKNHIGYNNIRLFRNNSRKYSGYKDSNPYYTPDYVIKITENNQSMYIIIDAKFSNPDTVKERQQSKLVYKYLFSISTIEPEDTILGLCVFCGKTSSNQDSSESLYDLSRRPISPYAQILTLTENSLDNSDDHFILLSDALQIEK